MLVRFGQVLLIAALLAATDTHWTLLQSVAWTAMLTDNLRKESVATAIERTFDGKHPCRLCKEIATGKKEGKKSELPGEVKKLQFSHTKALVSFPGPTPCPVWDTAVQRSEPRSHSPPTPPPRAVSA